MHFLRPLLIVCLAVATFALPIPADHAVQWPHKGLPKVTFGSQVRDLNRQSALLGDILDWHRNTHNDVVKIQVLSDYRFFWGAESAKLLIHTSQNEDRIFFLRSPGSSNPNPNMPSGSHPPPQPLPWGYPGSLHPPMPSGSRPPGFYGSQGPAVHPPPRGPPNIPSGFHPLDPYGSQRPLYPAYPHPYVSWGNSPGDPPEPHPPADVQGGSHPPSHDASPKPQDTRPPSSPIDRTGPSDTQSLPSSSSHSDPHTGRRNSIRKREVD